MKFRRTCTSAALAAATAGMLTATPAFATPTANVLVPASTAVTAALAPGTGLQVNFGGVVANCTTASFSGKTPKAGLAIPMPAAGDSIGGCTDSLAGSETVTLSGTWRLRFVTPRRARLVVPAGGATITTTLSNCVITLAPSGPSHMIGVYKPRPGTLAVTSQYVPETSTCSTSPSTVELTFTLVLTPAVKVVPAG